MARAAAVAAAVQAKEGPHQRAGVDSAASLSATARPDMPKVSDLVEDGLARAASRAGAGPGVLEAQLAHLLLCPVVARARCAACVCM